MCSYKPKSGLSQNRINFGALLCFALMGGCCAVGCAEAADDEKMAKKKRLKASL